MDLPINYDTAKYYERRAARLAYTQEQDNKCYHCSGSLDESPPDSITSKSVKWSLFPGGINFLKYPIHLHHDHSTGMTIGAVHAYCNAVLWQYHGK